MGKFKYVWIATLLLLASTATASDRGIHRFLLRPDPPVDPDARGKIELETENENGQKQETLEVEIEDIDTSAFTYSLWIEDAIGSANFVDAGNFTPDSGDPTEAEYESSTSTAPGLPLAARKLSDLRDRALEVRDDTGATILLGTIPDIRKAKKNNSDHNHENEEVQSPLLRPMNAPIPQATGKIEADDDDGESDLGIETEGFDVVAQTYTVWMDDGTDVLQDVGALEPDDGQSDHGQIEWSTENGGSLPLGATTLQELALRRVEIRDPLDQIVLEGEVPDISTQTSRMNLNLKLSTTSTGQSLRARGKARFALDGVRGRSRIDVSVKARTSDSSASLWIQNPATGALEEVASGIWVGKRNKRIRWCWQTQLSQPLPFGLTNPAYLAGRPIELRDESGAAILRGSF